MAAERGGSAAGEGGRLGGQAMEMRDPTRGDSMWVHFESKNTSDAHLKRHHHLQNADFVLTPTNLRSHYGLAL